MRLPKKALVLGLSTLFAAASATTLPAGAQTTDTVNETTTTTTTTAVTAPTVDTRVPGRVSGTITSVKGHLVTLQQSAQIIVVNDQPGLLARETGKVAVGRQVVALGYWQSGTFYATHIEGFAM
jgi:hypothetical protein